MPFCHAPWTNVDISPEGIIKPCCKFELQDYPRMNVRDVSFKEYKNSSWLGLVKQTWRHGKWPSGCNRCKIEEDNGIKSKRQLDLERWHNEYQEYDPEFHDHFLTASVAFGNTCNLKCITCGPIASSRWQKEYFAFEGKLVPRIDFYRNDFVEDFFKNSKGLIHLDIPGGEPFLSGIAEQLELLRTYALWQPHKMSLHYTTNATVWPGDEFWAAWKPFKEVEIQLSIDGTGDKFEFLRHPAKWDEVYTNIKRYQSITENNLKLSVSHTVSALNVYYLPEFFDWCESEGLPKPWCGRVQQPAWLRPTVWRRHNREKIAEKLLASRHEDVQAWGNLMLQENDSDRFIQFQHHIDWHNHYRGLNYLQVFPELRGWIKEGYYAPEK